MIGWHYTTYAAWQKIRTEGLIPQLIEKEAYRSVMRKPYKGIYLYPRKHSGHSHVGMIIHRAMVHQTWNICLLEVEYNFRNTVHIDPIDGYDIQLFHDGSLGDKDKSEWKYHIKEPIVIVTKKISPKNIKLHNSWNLEQLLEVK